MYKERRQKLLEALGAGGPSVAVFPAAPVMLRNADTEHDYRQDSDFYYLTGFDEPESVLVLSYHDDKQSAVVFVRRRDPARETWDGARLGVERAAEVLGVDAAFAIDDLEQRLPDCLANVRRLHVRLGRDRRFDERVLLALDRVRARARFGVIAPLELIDPAVVLHEMRIRKTSSEIETMTRAARITGEAHVRAMQVTRPGAWEYEVEAELLRVFRKNGAQRPAYGSIVGSGPNATVLHYRRNDRKMEAGDLLLIDAGCELDYCASDVTRTFPVSGTFSDPQRRVYEVVLEAQEAAIAATKPGATINAVHDVAVRVLSKGLIDLGVLAGSLDEAIEKETYKPYYMHRTSHWLGLDVHDVGAYYVDKKSRALEEGFVITVEPGLYFATDAAVDPKWKGIGVRIEDDVLVTRDGAKVLTAEIPKTVAAIETVLRDRP